MKDALPEKQKAVDAAKRALEAKSEQPFIMIAAARAVRLQAKH
jgi:hypothetical protein